MGIFSLIVAFFIGLVGSSFGTLVGGAGLIITPTLILLGLPPQFAVATNRFGGAGLAIFGLYEFNRKKLVNRKLGLILGIAALVGSFIGAHLMLQVDEKLLKHIIAVITILVLMIFFIKPQVGVEMRKTPIKSYEYIAGFFIAFLLGIYGGFYGAGLGAFYSYLLILLFGQTFMESAGTRKIMTLLVAVVATFTFIVEGVIDYPIGISLFLGMSLGSYIGAHYSDKIGNVWIKRLFFIIVIIMAIKLLV